MDSSIKLEPSTLEPEDTIIQADEFLDENPNIQNVETFSNTETSNKHQNRGDKTKSQRARKKNKIHNKINTNRIEKQSTTGEFTNYLKKQLLQKFQLEGWSPQTIQKYANIYNLNVKEVNEYFDQAAKEAQHYVYQECDSLSFGNITEWLKYFQAAGISEQCNYEPAIVMNAIANNEYHPEPSTIKGINLKKIYTFLSNALMGLPQQQLDDASAIFLSKEFQNLINEANTDEADNDVRDMKQKIEYSLHDTKNQNFYNLDPLNTHAKELEKCVTRSFNSNIKYEKY